MPSHASMFSGSNIVIQGGTFIMVHGDMYQVDSASHSTGKAMGDENRSHGLDPISRICHTPDIEQCSYRFPSRKADTQGYGERETYPTTVGCQSSTCVDTSVDGQLLEQSPSLMPMSRIGSKGSLWDEICQLVQTRTTSEVQVTALLQVVLNICTAVVLCLVFATIMSSLAPPSGITNLVLVAQAMIIYILHLRRPQYRYHACPSVQSSPVAAPFRSRKRRNATSGPGGLRRPSYHQIDSTRSGPPPYHANIGKHKQ